MFEKLLEKFLLKLFGRFISGLDKNNLHVGIWRGDLLIENVMMKDDILELVGLPMVVVFSNVGKIHIKIPWNKINSLPVEVYLQNIVVLAQKKAREKWEFNESLSLEKRFNDIIQYARKLVEQFEKKQDDREQSGQSFLSKLLIKIIDNIQLKVENIHFRYEDAASSYSFGVCLREITANTTDVKWSPSFVDRADKRNIDVPVNKLIFLDRLSVYWN